MAETVQGFSIKIEITNRITGPDGAEQRVSYSKTYNFTDGTGINQLGNQFNDEVRPLNTTSEDLDLGADGLKDFQNADLILSNIKVLLIENLDTGTGNDFLLKQGSTNPIIDLLGGTNPTLTIGPGGVCLLISPVDGYTVANNTADRLAMQALSNSNYRVLLAGDNV